MRIGVIPLAGQNDLDRGPWKHFLQGLEAHGSSVVNLASASEYVDALVVMNRRRDMDNFITKLGVRPERSALILMEPRVSLPGLYQASYLGLFKHRFAASPLWSREVGARSFLWPQDTSTPEVSHRCSAEVAMLCSNKRSAVRGSLYGLRRNVIRSLQETGTDLALYGSGWSQDWRINLGTASRASVKALVAGQKPEFSEAFRDLSFKPSSFRGFVADKATGLAAAPISIVIENSADYVSEKLVDAVRLGRLPIYVGPPLDEFSIPPEVAMTAPPIAHEIQVTARRAILSGDTGVVNAGREWLKSAGALLHSAQVVLRNLGQDVAESITF